MEFITNLNDNLTKLEAKIEPSKLGSYDTMQVQPREGNIFLYKNEKIRRCIPTTQQTQRLNRLVGV